MSSDIKGFFFFNFNFNFFLLAYLSVCVSIVCVPSLHCNPNPLHFGDWTRVLNAVFLFGLLTLPTKARILCFRFIIELHY